MVFLAMITYLIGTLGVTVFGNVPLNDVLEAINLSDLTKEQLTTTREAYEVKWNTWHKIRTLCAVTSFAAIMFTQVFHK